MQFGVLSGDAVRHLLVDQKNDTDASADYAICSVGDYFRQVETIKKSGLRGSLLASIRSRGTRFHIRVDEGTVYMPPLQLSTLQDAAFESNSFDPDPQFHSDIERADVPPEFTVGMLVLREFDKVFGATSSEDYLGLMS